MIRCDMCFRGIEDALIRHMIQKDTVIEPNRITRGPLKEPGRYAVCLTCIAEMKTIGTLPSPVVDFPECSSCGSYVIGKMDRCDGCGDFLLCPNESCGKRIREGYGTSRICNACVGQRAVVDGKFEDRVDRSGKVVEELLAVGPGPFLGAPGAGGGAPGAENVASMAARPEREDRLAKSTFRTPIPRDLPNSRLARLWAWIKRMVWR